MTITMKELADKIEELAKKYPEREANCEYVERTYAGLVPVCVVGCAVLDLAGEEGLEVLNRVNATQIQQLLVPTSHMYGAVGAMYGAVGAVESQDRENARKLFEEVEREEDSPYLSFVQSFQLDQDKGMSWGGAYSINKYLLDRARAQEKNS